MYSWERIAVRTERVYDAVADSRRDDSMLARLGRFHKCVLPGRPAAEPNCINPTAAERDMHRISAAEAHSCAILELLKIKMMCCAAPTHVADRSNIAYHWRNCDAGRPDPALPRP